MLEGEERQRQSPHLGFVSGCSSYSFHDQCLAFACQQSDKARQSHMGRCSTQWQIESIGRTTYCLTGHAQKTGKLLIGPLCCRARACRPRGPGSIGLLHRRDSAREFREHHVEKSGHGVELGRGHGAGRRKLLPMALRVTEGGPSSDNGSSPHPRRRSGPTPQVCCLQTVPQAWPIVSSAAA